MKNIDLGKLPFFRNTANQSVSCFHFTDSADFESDDYDDDDDALAFQNPIIFQLPNVSQSLLDKARSALHRHQFDESFAWYCTMFECLKESHSAENDEAVKLEDVENEFSTVVNCFSKLLLNQGRTEDANECIQKVSLHHVKFDI